MGELALGCEMDDVNIAIFLTSNTTRFDNTFIPGIIPQRHLSRV